MANVLSRGLIACGTRNGRNVTAPKPELEAPGLWLARIELPEETT